jgi:hypothetical protein
VHYRHNDNRRILYPKVNTEWESMNDSASCVPMNIWVHQWCFSNIRKHRQHFIKELVPQALPLLLVP